MTRPTRRSVVAGAAAIGVVAAATPWSSAMTTQRQPAIYLPHGGGPWPWLDPSVFSRFGGGYDTLRAYLEALPASLPEPPKAIVCVTAHWEASEVTVSAGEQPGMLYDYGGFPAHTYSIEFPAPGSPAVAARVLELLSAAGIASTSDTTRGYDHGTFVPLAVAWPKAEVPVVQLSLLRGLSPSKHLDIGRALAPLRDEGVLIIGSGMSYHNMRGFGSPAGAEAARTFDTWLQGVASATPAEREEALRHWTKGPAARACHPREEHLLPLMVIAGAGASDPGSVPFSDLVLGTTVSAVRFG